MNLAAVEKLLSETIGLDAEATGGKALEIAVSAELKRTGLADADAYVDRLRRSPVDLDRLIEATVVPETWFFRDSAPFQLLGEQARELWPAAQSRIARVLSAPCSTGEEPYSIAIALLQAGLRPERICIDAVDISVRALETARRAVYGKSSFRDAEYSGWEPYFETTPDGIRVTDEVAGLVRFHRRNLIEQTDWPGPETYHAVF
jgi:chemotaxis protein methyltransferase WspC